MRPRGPGVGPQQMSGLQPDAEEEACGSFALSVLRTSVAASEASPSLIAVILV